MATSITTATGVDGAMQRCEETLGHTPCKTETAELVVALEKAIEDYEGLVERYKALEGEHAKASADLIEAMNNPGKDLERVRKASEHLDKVSAALEELRNELTEKENAIDSLYLKLTTADLSYQLGIAKRPEGDRYVDGTLSQWMDGSIR